jgi:hypothetical protein
MGKLYVNIRLNVALLTCMKTINSIAGTLMKGGNKQTYWSRIGKKQNQTGVIQSIKPSTVYLSKSSKYT